MDCMQVNQTNEHRQFDTTCCLSLISTNALILRIKASRITTLSMYNLALRQSGQYIRINCLRHGNSKRTFDCKNMH
jgi:hypothetical protein